MSGVSSTFIGLMMQISFRRWDLHCLFSLLVFASEVALRMEVSVAWSVGQIAMTLCIDTHVTQWLNHHDLRDPLTFTAAPPAGYIFNLSDTFIKTVKAINFLYSLFKFHLNYHVRPCTYTV